MSPDQAVSEIRAAERALAVAQRDLDRLRARRRKARIVLRGHGWSYRRIGALSGCTDSAVEKDVNRA